jgi:hypothetical protein
MNIYSVKVNLTLSDPYKIIVIFYTLFNSDFRCQCLL